MLDPSIQTAPGALPAVPAKSRAVFRMIGNDRMAGSVPAWVPAESAKDVTLAALAQTQGSPFSADLANAMAYAPQDGGGVGGDRSEEPFGFDDLLDIVNPLQHIPVVSTVYRAVTGDGIRPSSEIIGGAIYGGMAGAASGLANAVIKKETGKNMGEHALALVTGNQRSPAPAIPSVASIDRDKPLERLAAAQAQMTVPMSALPGNMLSFADLGRREPGNRPVKPIPAQPVRYAEIYRFNA